jgi:glycosyltransferase involved in cell wall biosynthesis
VALNAWDLAERPSAVDAWRTQEILEMTGPAVAGWRWTLIHPATHLADLPEGVESAGVGIHTGEWGRLLFEQWGLPRAAALVGADVLIPVAGNPPMSSRVPVVTEGRQELPSGKGVASRLRDATRAAASLGGSFFTWSDLPDRDRGMGRASRLSPWVADRFHPQAESEDAGLRTRLGIGDGYVLALGIGKNDIALLLSAWSWVAPSVGELHPLVLAGMDAGVASTATRLASSIGLGDSVHFANHVRYGDLPAILRGGAALLVPGKPEDGQLLRWAAACGLPVAAAATPQAESILGQAAFVTPAGDARALGAACLSVLVDEGLAESLRQLGVGRAAAYHSGRGVEELAGLLRRIASPS